MFPDKASVPSIVLSFGPLIHVLVLLLVWHYLIAIPAKERFFPRLIVGDLETRRLTHSWEKGSAVATLALPIVAFVWAWERFLSKGAVFEKASGLEVGRFEYVPPSLILGGWDVHRYGDITSQEASSFLPFWQPVFVMGGGTTLVVVLTLRIVFHLRKRAPIRKRFVNRPT